MNKLGVSTEFFLLSLTAASVCSNSSSVGKEVFNTCSTCLPWQCVCALEKEQSKLLNSHERDESRA